MTLGRADRSGADNLQSGRPRGWTGGQPAIVFCAVLGVAIAVYGTAGIAKFTQFAVPQAWIIVILTAVLLAGPRPGEALGGAWRWLLWSTLPVLALQQLAYAADGQRADLVVLIGWLVLLIGLELAAIAPRRLRRMLVRLRDRGVLGGDSATTSAVESDIERAGRVGADVGRWSVVAVLLVTWPRAAEVPDLWRTWAFGPAVADQILIVVAGAAVGGWLGCMAGYGRLGSVLARRRTLPRVVPGHPDGAGGLRPIGAFYLYQSFVASLPAIFLAVWILVVSLAGDLPLVAHYRPFLGQYLALLAIAILFEAAVFVAPLRSMHKIMLSQKDETLLAEADRLSPAIEAARQHLDSLTGREAEAARQHLNELVERYHRLENAPTWPVDPSIRRRFTMRHLGLLVPFAGYVVGQTSFWEQVSDLISGWGS